MDISFENPVPFITIAIPTVNRVEYLKKSLSSALLQTFKDIEIIVSNNGSTDTTQEYLETISDERVKVYHQSPQLCAISNWNFCLQKAKGEYFLLLSDDDMIDQNFAEQCAHAYNANKRPVIKIPIIYSHASIIDSHDNCLTKLINPVNNILERGEKFISESFKGKRSAAFCATLYRTEDLMAIGGFDCENVFAADAIARGKLCINSFVLYVPLTLSYYRIHESNGGRSYDETYRLRYTYDALNRILSALEDVQWYQKIFKAGLYFARNNFVTGLGRAHNKFSFRLLLEFILKYVKVFGYSNLLFWDIPKYLLSIFMNPLLIRRIKNVLGI